MSLLLSVTDDTVHYSINNMFNIITNISDLSEKIKREFYKNTALRLPSETFTV